MKKINLSVALLLTLTACNNESNPPQQEKTEQAKPPAAWATDVQLMHLTGRVKTINDSLYGLTLYKNGDWGVHGMQYVNTYTFDDAGRLVTIDRKFDKNYREPEKEVYTHSGDANTGYTKYRNNIAIERVVRKWDNPNKYIDSFFTISEKNNTAGTLYEVRYTTLNNEHQPVKINSDYFDKRAGEKPVTFIEYPDAMSINVSTQGAAAIITNITIRKSDSLNNPLCKINKVSDDISSTMNCLGYEYYK
ncbi:MAG: hypothetical protein JST82_01490 [Bacteroidetes bacterium]|nr:hypothetical protein [Bacteroidota bacterium]